MNRCLTLDGLFNCYLGLFLLYCFSLFLSLFLRIPKAKWLLILFVSNSLLPLSPGLLVVNPGLFDPDLPRLLPYALVEKPSLLLLGGAAILLGVREWVDLFVVTKIL